MSCDASINPFVLSPQGTRRFSFRPISALLLSALFLTQLPSCHNPTEPPPDVPPEFISRGILPLKVGYYWQYDRYALTDSGTTAGKIGSIGFKISGRSVSASPQYGDTVLHWVPYDPQTGQTGYVEWFYRNYSDGLYIMGGRAPTDSVYTKLQLLKYPVRKGDAWTRPHLIFHILDQKFSIPDSLSYACIDTNALFETPLGTFACIVYNHMEPIEEIPGKEYDILEFYSRTIGKVGEIRHIYSTSTHDRFPIQKDVLVSTNVEATD